MAFSLKLPERWGERGWKVKIRDRERLEPPHATVLFRTQAWRWDLRTRRFMDHEPSPKDVPSELVDELVRSWAVLKEAWDRMYPENPVLAEDCHDE